jgi:hypothetical protein
MTYAERLYSWNRRYDELPQEYRFQFVFWFVIAVAALNMALTIADGFPFGLLVLLAVAWIASIRVPFVLGWVKPSHGHDEAAGHAAATAHMEIHPPRWVYRLNHWYDAVPEFERPFYLLGALVVAGAVNMALTIAYAFPFGLLFLLAFLAVLAIRAPFVAGWFVPDAAPAKALALPRQEPHGEVASVPAMHLSSEPAPAHGADASHHA